MLESFPEPLVIWRRCVCVWEVCGRCVCAYVQGVYEVCVCLALVAGSGGNSCQCAADDSLDPPNPSLLSPAGRSV